MPNQKGGFPPVTDVAIPLGLTMIAHWLSESQEDSAIRQLERSLAENYEGFVEMLPKLPRPLTDLLSTSPVDSESMVSELDEMEMEGGEWAQIARDLSTPAILTASAHLLSSVEESDEDVEISPAQKGGLGVGAGVMGQAMLKTLDDLIVPLGLMTGSHLLRNLQDDSSEMSGGMGNLIDLSVPLGLTVIAHTMAQNDKKSPLDMYGGSGLPVIGDTYLGKWLAENSVNVLTPRTLLPLGLVFVLYMAYRRYVTQNGEDGDVELSERPNILDMANRDDLARYARQRGIKRLEPDTPFPFALAMGPETFGTYVDEEQEGGAVVDLSAKKQKQKGQQLQKIQAALAAKRAKRAARK